MSERIGVWLDPTMAFEASYKRLCGMTVADLESLKQRDPELTQHYEDTFPDVIGLLHIKEWGGFRTIEEAQDFINQDSDEQVMADLMAWDGFRTEDEAQAFIDTNLDL